MTSHDLPFGARNQFICRAPWKLQLLCNSFTSASAGQWFQKSQSLLHLVNPLEHASFSGQAVPTVIVWELVLLQQNIEGISKTKLEIISHLAMENKATTILLQEMHATRPDVLTIPGYSFAAHTISDSYGIATFVIDSAKWNKITFSQPGSDIEWAVAEVEGVNITNIYKPPGIPLVTDSLPCHPSPCIYASDFNCHSTTWGYSTTNPDRTTLEDWVSTHDLTELLYPKQPRSFRSA